MPTKNRELQRQSTRKHYQNNKAYYKNKAILRKKKLYEGVIVPVKDVPCANCHDKFPTVCMDFDHVRGKKLFDIAKSYADIPLAKLLEEISKCDVVCANCHRIRTSQR